MGQKDFQQMAIVQNMIEQLAIPVALVMCPIIREKDGLAMSSRNVRLNEKERSIAPLISKTLYDAKAKLGKKSIDKIKKEALKQLNIPEFRVEYFEIADGTTLQAIKSLEGVKTAVACTAVHLGPVRLIDNVVLK